MNKKDEKLVPESAPHEDEKMAEVKQLISEFKQHVEGAVEEALIKIPSLYGRYQSLLSPSNFFELYHDEASGDIEDINTKVIFRKGKSSRGEDTYTEENLTRLDAFQRGLDLIIKSYALQHEGKTRSAIDEKIAEVPVSNVEKEGITGTYVHGQAFARIAEYCKNSFSVERGYDGMVTGSVYDLSEEQIRAKHEQLLIEGFVPEGQEEEVEYSNPFEAFGLQNEEVELDVKPEGSFDFSIFS